MISNFQRAKQKKGKKQKAGLFIARLSYNHEYFSLIKHD